MFHSLSDDVLVAPQLSIADVARAQAQGVALIVNNRPEGESPDQVPGGEIAAAAAAAGLGYAAIPVTPGGFSADQVEALRRALGGANGPALLYCKSGTRSALLWALAEASGGGDPDAIAAALFRAGYSADPVRPALDALALQARAAGSQG